MRSVNQLLEAKGRQVWTIEPGATVYRALELLAEKGIGALVVMDEGRLAGILSERDYARKVELAGRDAHQTQVQMVMTPGVITVAPGQPVDDCMTLMTEHRIRHLPVVQEGQVVGLISIGDVVKEVIAEQEFQIEQLSNYISGQQ
jgi:CBS domain-containing protein